MFMQIDIFMSVILLFHLLWVFMQIHTFGNVIKKLESR